MLSSPFLHHKREVFMSVNFSTGLNSSIEARPHQPMREQLSTVQQQNAGAVTVSSDAVQATSNTQDASRTEENLNSGDQLGSLTGNTSQQLEEAVANIQEVVQSISRDLNFSLDDSTGSLVVKVTDTKSGDLIRQIPSEEALNLAKRLDEVRSFLFEGKA